MSRGNGEIADGIKLLDCETIDILLVATAYLEAKATVRIFLHKVVNDCIVNEEFQILVIVVDGGLPYLASMQIFVHRTDIGDGKVSEGNYLAPRAQEASEDTVASLSAFRHMPLKGTLFTVGREIHFLGTLTLIELGESVEIEAVIAVRFAHNLVGFDTEYRKTLIQLVFVCPTDYLVFVIIPLVMGDSYARREVLLLAIQTEPYFHRTGFSFFRGVLSVINNVKFQNCHNA